MRATIGTMSVSPAGVRALLERHGLHPSRALGQNFLADANTARRIVRLAGVGRGDRVLEIGPGVGSLTVELARAGAHVVALELDRFLLPVLEDVVRGTGDVCVVSGDAMTVDLDALLDGRDRWHLVSNLPYHVAAPIVAEALQHAPTLRSYCVMVQKEVGERFFAPEGSKGYNALSALLRTTCVN